MPQSANKVQIKNAVEKLFKVKVADVRTANMLRQDEAAGPLRGLPPNWKRAYVKLKAGEKMPEFAEI